MPFDTHTIKWKKIQEFKKTKKQKENKQKQRINKIKIKYIQDNDENWKQEKVKITI